MSRYFAFLLFGLFYVSSAMAIDLAPLWDFNQPELSEQRFRAALADFVGCHRRHDLVLHAARDDFA